MRVLEYSFKFLKAIFLIAMFIAPLAFIASALFNIGDLGFWEGIGVFITAWFMVALLDETQSKLYRF